MKLTAAFAVLLALAMPAGAQDTAQDATKRQLQARATEAVIWGMPAVNADLMLQAMLTRTAAKENQIVYWGKPLDWHNQTLTPNPDTLYLMAFLNTKDVGPIVIEIPPAGPDGSMNANIMNVWQMPLEDGGLMGIDKGKGVKFLILPPDHKGPVPSGYTALQPGTWGSFGLFRSNLSSHSDADVAKSVAYGKRLKVYPLSQAAKPVPNEYTDVQGAVFDSTIRYDASFYENLNRVVQAEPWLDRDRVMIDVLKTLGIEKGKPFSPSSETKQAFEASVREAHAALAARYDAGLPPFYEGTHWSLPGPPELVINTQAGYTDPNAYPVDSRGMVYHYAYIGIKRMGVGQFYMISIKDKDGQNYDGGKTYRLTVPPNAPVDQYWSVTAYDRETHALIRNMSRASRASNNAEVKKNANGSVDLYFGPKAPEGQESNWIPTDPTRRFELMFRAYGPKKEFFEKAWKLPNVERMP